MVIIDWIEVIEAATNRSAYGAMYCAFPAYLRSQRVRVWTGRRSIKKRDLAVVEEVQRRNAWRPAWHAIPRGHDQSQLRQIRLNAIRQLHVERRQQRGGAGVHGHERDQFDEAAFAEVFDGPGVEIRR